MGGIDVAIPNAENMLIHLAAHAAFHGSVELRWLVAAHLLRSVTRPILPARAEPADVSR